MLCARLLVPTLARKIHVNSFSFRNLKYFVDTGDFKNKSCYVAVFIKLPPSLYVNVDELADLRRLHKVNEN